MRQWGMWVTGAIAAIVIVGLIVYGPQIGKLIQKSTLGGVPLYPDAESNQPEGMDWDAYWDYFLPAGWSAHLYESSAAPDIIADWYRLQMIEWNVENDFIENHKYLPGFPYGSSFICLVFSKGNNGVIIKIYQASYSPRFLIMAGPKDGISYASKVIPLDI